MTCCLVCAGVQSFAVLRALYNHSAAPQRTLFPSGSWTIRSWTRLPSGQTVMFTFLTSSEVSYLDILVYGITRGAAGIAILVAAPIVTLLVVTVPLQLHRIAYAPKDIPWVGQGSYTWFPKLRSSLVALKNERLNLEEGWEKVCLRPT